MTLLSETRERFLRAIVAQVPIDRIAEIHFFHPIKQGGVETGVAVIAAWPEVDAATPPVAQETTVAEDEMAEDEMAEDEMAEEELAEEELAEDAADGPPVRDLRPVVYAAHYRHTLKGPDRGKWETNVVEEAEAPLVTVEAVVRGVQRRAGDAEDAVRMSGDELRAALPEPQNPAA